jgi:small subunit ribosomal protein S16
MKMMGRKHRPFFRICAMDVRRPRDGRVLEELGTYDPLVPDTDARVVLNGERVSYWLGVGAQPTEKVRVLIKKYGAAGTRVEQQKAARERLAMPKIVPPPGPPAYVPKKEEPAAEAPAAEAPPAESESPPAEAAADAPAE